MTFTQPNYRYLRRHRGGRWNVAAGRKLGDFKPWRNRVTFDVSAAQRIVRLVSKDAIRGPKITKISCRCRSKRATITSSRRITFHFTLGKRRLHALWRVGKFLPIRRNGLDLFWTDFGFACQVFRGWNSRYLNFLLLLKSREIFNDKRYICYIF